MLYHDLLDTKSGRKILERCGIETPPLGVCNLTGTPTVAVPRLMYAVEAGVTPLTMRELLITLAQGDAA